MNLISISVQIINLQKKMKKANIFSTICQIKGNKLIETQQCSSIEEIENYLFFNRGEYTVVFLRKFLTVNSEPPFEKFICLN